jgi:hypothetical protein
LSGGAGCQRCNQQNDEESRTHKFRVPQGT